jgi:hypothetical protein
MRQNTFPFMGILCIGLALSESAEAEPHTIQLEARQSNLLRRQIGGSPLPLNNYFRNTDLQVGVVNRHSQTRD